MKFLQKLNRHKNIQVGVLLLALLMIVIAGCSSNNQQTASQAPTESATESPKPATTTPAESESDPIPASWKVEHELDTMTLDRVPEKVVVLDMYLLDIVLALGIEPIGIASESAGEQELPPYLQSKLQGDFTWVGARNDPNLELLSQLEPDLIIGDLQRHQEGYDMLSKIAPTFIVTGSGANDWKNTITKLGEVFQRQEKAAAVIADFDQQLANGKQQLASKGQFAVAPLTLYTQSKVRVYTKDSYTGSILAGMGFTLPFEADVKPFEEISVEAIGDLKVDAFILLQSPQFTADVDPNNFPIFSTLPTVQAGNAKTVSMEQWAFYRGPLAGKVIIEEALELFSTQQ